MNNGDEPAYPGEQGETQEGTWNQTFRSGLTKREAFAMAAMQGLMTQPTSHERPIAIARQSVQAADALLAALKEPK